METFKLIQLWMLILFALVAFETAPAPENYRSARHLPPYHINYYADDQRPISNLNMRNSQEGTDDSIHLASWGWDRVGKYITFTIFIVITGLAKVAFHHAHWLSSRVPESCLLICIGIVVGCILFWTQIHSDIFPTFTPSMFFFALLPPVILESAYSLYDRSFFVNLPTILIYAVIGTILNVLLIGASIYLLLLANAISMDKLRITNIFVFAALISAVDPVAVLAIFQEVGVNKDLYYLLFGESLLNDAVTVVLYETTKTFMDMNVIPPLQFGLAVLSFFTVSLGGLSMGIVYGLLTGLITKLTSGVRVVEPLAVLGIAYLSYVSAELFHFSGIMSMIGCGLVQSHYALKNISRTSKTTVVYFTKMLSSTMDAIIFLFLGIVLITRNHIWNTKFILYSLLLCFFVRFIVVFTLTYIVNKYRVKKIYFQEQFIMAYGGLRGAVAFSLVKMLQDSEHTPANEFMTTTLVIILCTVFIQGSTIKLFVHLFNIEKSGSEEKTMSMEIFNNVSDNVMAGIEEITGIRGDNYVRRKLLYYDQHYLRKIFLRPDKGNELLSHFEKLALSQHYAHLYGPVALVEDKKTPILHEPVKRKLPRSVSARVPPPKKHQEMHPDVELRRRRTLSDTTKPDPRLLQTQSQDPIYTSTEQLRRAFRSNPYTKLHERYDPNLIREANDIEMMLRRRALRARRIAKQAAIASRASISTEERSLMGEFEKPLRQIYSELQKDFPEDLEGIDALLERANKRKVARHSSAAGSTSAPRSSDQSDEQSISIKPVQRSFSFAPRLSWIYKSQSKTEPDSEPTPETQRLYPKKPRPKSTRRASKSSMDEESDNEKR